MTRVNRSVMPEIRLPKKLTFPPYEIITFANGLRVYLINYPQHDLCKIEWIFNAGRWYEPQKSVARFTCRQLREGSLHLTAQEISEKLDFIGATLQTTSTVDHAFVSVLTLNKHMETTLALMEDIIKRPAFSEQELELAIRNSREKLRVELQKNEFVADQKMPLLLYGKNHPYGYEDEEKNFDALTPSVMKDFHNKYFTASQAFVIVSGNVTENIKKLLEKYFGDQDWKGAKNEPKVPPFEPASEHILELKKQDALQSSIRICGPTIAKTHSDYHMLSILNTILGGYFGSRLMTNIREDKGYTYGIFSGITHSLHASYFFISAEIGVDVVKATLNEIIFEIDRLKNEPVSEEELQVVRNYLTGKLLSSLDSPFSVASLYKNLFIYGLDVTYLHGLMEAIHTVTSKDLCDTANRYLNMDQMYQIVVG